MEVLVIKSIHDGVLSPPMTLVEPNDSEYERLNEIVYYNTEN